MFIFKAYICFAAMCAVLESTGTYPTIDDCFKAHDPMTPTAEQQARYAAWMQRNEGEKGYTQYIYEPKEAERL